LTADLVVYIFPNTAKKDTYFPITLDFKIQSKVAPEKRGEAFLLPGAYAPLI
jgi:hypothetical protein